MILAYDSRTGNTRRFTERVAALTGLSARPVTEEGTPWGEFLLLTHSWGQGEVPGDTLTLLRRHGAGLRGVVCSGSFHWGEQFGQAGRTIAREYHVPLVLIINKSGSDADVQAVADWLEKASHAELRRTEQPSPLRHHGGHAL